MNFNENLRALRKEKDFSQEYLAEKMNVSRQTISKWENGTAMPDLKKLTELAEFFDTSMDELLGTSSPSPRDSSIDIEELQYYAYSITKNQIDAFEKKNKTWQIITSISIIILTIALIITNKSITNVSNDLVNNHSSQIVYQDNDYEETANDLTKVFVSKIDKKDPRNVELTFIYNPKSYVKGTEVTFVVKDMTSSQLDDGDVVAELQSNGEFVATKKINFAGFNSASIKIDDGSNVTTETLELDWAALYHGFTDFYIDYNVEGSNSQKTIDFLNNFVRWENSEEMPSINEAYVEVKYDGKTIESKKLEIQTDDIYSSVSLTNMNVKIDNFDFEKIQVYVKLVDEYGSKYYVDCMFIQLDNASNITIEFAHGGRLSTESYNEKTLLE